MSATVSAQNGKPEIVENYCNFESPPHIRPMLDELLEALPIGYLRGLETIVLTNQAALTRDQRRTKTWSRNHKVRIAHARGWYQGSWKSSPAVIYLCVDNILRSELPSLRCTPLLRYEALGTVLYHEIGHHIDGAVRPAYGGKEYIAENWSRKLFVQFLRSHYWYLRPFFYPLRITLRIVLWLRNAKSKTRHI